MRYVHWWYFRNTMLAAHTFRFNVTLPNDWCDAINLISKSTFRNHSSCKNYVNYSSYVYIIYYSFISMMCFYYFLMLFYSYEENSAWLHDIQLLDVPWWKLERKAEPSGGSLAEPEEFRRIPSDDNRINRVGRKRNTHINDFKMHYIIQNKNIKRFMHDFLYFSVNIVYRFYQKKSFTSESYYLYFL